MVKEILHSCYILCAKPSTRKRTRTHVCSVIGLWEVCWLSLPSPTTIVGLFQLDWHVYAHHRSRARRRPEQTLYSLFDPFFGGVGGDLRVFNLKNDP